MRTFTHSSCGAFIVSEVSHYSGGWQPYHRRFLNNCVVCYQSLNPYSEAQVYAHIHCWRTLSNVQKNYTIAQLSDKLRVSLVGTPLDFLLPPKKGL